MWIRVQQLNTSGSMILPRVGWEMDVGFLDGDPDRPVVLQKLYNRETMPPYGMPATTLYLALRVAQQAGLDEAATRALLGETMASLLDHGVIDSTGVLEVIAFIERRFEIRVDDEEILPENLDSVARISAYVQRKRG